MPNYRIPDYDFKGSNARKALAFFMQVKKLETISKVRLKK